MKTKKNKKKTSKFDKIMFRSLTTLSIILVLSIVFSQISLSKVNLEVEKLKIKVNDQENVNQSLSMKINELASLDQIQKVASEQGLEYNNDNIKTVTE